MMKKTMHWLKAVLILQLGIIATALLMSNPQYPLYRPAWVYWSVLTLFVGLMPLYLFRRHCFQLRSLLFCNVVGLFCGALTRFWQAEFAGFGVLFMIFSLCLFSATNVSSQNKETLDGGGTVWEKGMK